MARKKQASFKMKGHTLPGVNQKSETVNIKDGRSPSSAFQQKSSLNNLPGTSVAMGDLSNENEDAEAGKKLLKDEAKEAMEGESAIAMKSPNKKKLKTGTKTKVGGKLNEGTSPHQKL